MIKMWIAERSTTRWMSEEDSAMCYARYGAWADHDTAHAGLVDAVERELSFTILVVNGDVDHPLVLQTRTALEILSTEDEAEVDGILFRIFEVRSRV